MLAVQAVGPKPFAAHFGGQLTTFHKEPELLIGRPVAWPWNGALRAQLKLNFFELAHLAVNRDRAHAGLAGHVINARDLRRQDLPKNTVTERQTISHVDFPPATSMLTEGATSSIEVA